MKILDGKMPIYHFTEKCILSVHQKKFNSISEYDGDISYEKKKRKKFNAVVN
jgi:hypothetical protein